MAMVTTEITIDVVRIGVYQTIVAKQLDYDSRFLKVTITNDGVPIPIDTSSTVIFGGKRKDGDSRGFEGTVNSDGTVTVPLASWLLEMEGIATCDITIVDSKGRKLSTASFYLAVEKAIYDGSEISEDENYGILVKLLGEISKAKGSVDEILTRVGNATSSAEEKADLADKAARKANEVVDTLTNLAEGSLKATAVSYDNTDSGLDASDVQTAIDKLVKNKEVEPFIVNVEAEWKAQTVSESGGVAQVKYGFVVTNADKTYDEICDAASNGLVVIASVYGAGHTSAMDVEKPSYTLCLTEYDGQLIGGGRAVFSGTIITDENVCEAVILTLKKSTDWDNGTVETWSIEKVSFPSKDYVDEKIEEAAQFVVHIDVAADGTVTANKTYAEMIAAYESGKMLLGTYTDSNGVNVQVASVFVEDYRNVIIFTAIYDFASHMIGCNSNNEWFIEFTNMASEEYVDNQIGDIETALDNIITKYGLGGDAV